MSYAHVRRIDFYSIRGTLFEKKSSTRHTPEQLPMKKHIYTTILLLLVSVVGAKAQTVGIKTNLLYGAYTLTPNIGVEVALGRSFTIDLSAGYNPWNLNSDEDKTKKLVHLLGQAELRYWFCGKYNGLFVGAHGLLGKFNIGGYDLPWLLETGSENFRYEGVSYGGGVSVGYQFLLSKRWNIELNVGGGYARLNYDKYDCVNCGYLVDSNTGKNYWGITRAGISIIFLL